MMKRSPIQKYIGSLHEGIADEILKMLFIHKMKPHLNKVEKQLNDPEITAKLETIRYAVEDFERHLKNYCKYNPDDYDCKKRKF